MADLVGQEPMPELRIITMRIEHGVRDPCFVELGVGDRLGQPTVESLATKLEDFSSGEPSPERTSDDGTRARALLDPLSESHGRRAMSPCEDAAVTVIEEVVETECDGAPMAVLRKRPARPGHWPMVVMFHDGPGIRGATHEFSARLAADGFDVVVPDLYHRHGRLLGWELHEREADPTIVDRLWELLSTLTDAGAQADLDAALVAVGADPNEPMGAIGFCVGARAVFRAMIRLPDRFAAGAMWHPSYLVDDGADSPHLSAAQLQGPLFIGIGEADQMQPLSSHRPFLQAVARRPGIDVITYPGADHGYTWRGWPSYDQAAADASFEATVALFHRALDR